MGRSILVASGKGGSGKTTFAISLGVVLARRKYKVCILDLNFGLRNDDIYIGLEDKVIFDIGDIMSGVCKVEKALVRADAKYGDLYLLESTQNKRIKGITEAHIRALLLQLKRDFDYVIVDAPDATNSDFNLVSGQADTAVLIVTPDPLSLRNTDSVDKILQSAGVKSRCSIINMVKFDLQEQEYAPSIEEITRVLAIPMAGIIPYDENVIIGNNIGTPVVAVTESYISRNMEEIVTRMLG